MIYLEENRKEAGQSDSKDEVDTKGMDYCFFACVTFAICQIIITQPCFGYTGGGVSWDKERRFGQTIPGKCVSCHTYL